MQGLEVRTVVLSAVLGCAAPGAVFPATVDVLSSAGDRLVLEVGFDAPRLEEVEVEGRTYHRVLIDGCGWVTEPGHPQVPVRGLAVGIPFGARPRLRVLEVEEGGDLAGVRVLPAPRYEPIWDEHEIGQLVPIHEADAAIYGGGAHYPGSWAEVGWEGTLRFQRVVQVAVFPFRWNPAGGGTWARRVTVEVRWESGSEEKGLVPAPEEPLWEGTYRRVVINHEAARAWRRSPAPTISLKRSWARDEEFKLFIRESGLYEIRYEDLEGASGPVPIEEVGVYQKSYVEGVGVPWEEVPVPIHLVDEEGDGFFGPSDRFYFWAEGFWDAYVEYGYEDRYSLDNVYWVGIGSAGGARMDTVGVWEGAVAGTLRTFLQSSHFEEERYYHRTPAGRNLDDVPPDADVEQWFWTDWGTHQAQLEVSVYDVEPASVPLVRARFQGFHSGTHRFIVKMLNGSLEAAPEDSFTFYDRAEYLFESTSMIPSGFLTDGKNYFEYEGWWYLGGSESRRPAAYADWVEIRYDRRLVARDGYLAFNAGDRKGAWAFRVEGFEDDAIQLFDLTEPAAEAWVALPPGAVEPDGDGYRLTFADSIGASGRWAAVAEGAGRRLSGDRIEKDEISSLYTSEADYIIISHPLFLDGVQPLAAYREAQGLRVQRASITDIYDEFSGGIKDPVAIKRYLQWGFEHWTVKPQFALIVGDASEDHLGIYADSGPDFVPSISSYAHGELEAIDNWFVRFHEDDLLLDMYLGRLSVGSEAELEAVLDKTLAYEAFSPEETWRGRVLLVSDDKCSGTETTPYRCNVSTEADFEGASVDAAESARRGVGAPLEVLEFHMSEYTGRGYEDGYHARCFAEDVINPLGCVRDSVYENLTPMLFDILNEGVLFFTFQGHGNRWVMFHEYLVTDSVRFHATMRGDVVRRSANYGRPYIVHGFGCHFADFNEPEEDYVYTQDCLLERMFLLADRGAVAALGSTGFEEARTNAEYERHLYRVLFENPPTVTVEGGGTHVRWLLGEVQAAAIASLAVGQWGRAFLNRYVLLGDPALRIDALPPRMEVTVDGVPAENGGVFTGGDSSVVMIRARVGDEVAIDSTSISVAIVEGDVVTNLVAGEDYSIARDTTATDGRLLVIEYAHEIRLAAYDLVFSARDWNGRPVTFVLKVRFSFRAWFDGQVAVDGSRVLPGAEVLLEIVFPRRVGQEELDVELEGPMGVQAVDAETTPVPGDETGTKWQIAFPLGEEESGTYDLFLVFGADKRKMMWFEIAERLAIESMTAYPNPFEDETGFSFVLSRPAAVRVRIFTVAGRLVNTLRHEGNVDYNYLPWDGQDKDGADVANGTYLYQIRARAGEEVVTSEIGKVVRIE